jgi:hypothetical protein
MVAEAVVMVVVIALPIRSQGRRVPARTKRIAFDDPMTSVELAVAGLEEQSQGALSERDCCGSD